MSTIRSLMRRLAWSSLLLAWTPAPAAQSRPPNVVIFFVDNFGNGDLGCFGSTLHRTPHIDRMAAEGTKFTSFYAASGVCTPSRAALLTGSYPRRVNLHFNDVRGSVLRPIDSRGLHAGETTIAELLKTLGYATGAFGKWHLGDQVEFLPTRHGFDTFFGIPYAEDMVKDKKPEIWPELPLLRDEKVIEAPVDRNFLAQRVTREAIAFIERNRDRPFFAYVPHSSPGSTPHPFASPAFRGKSKNGDYGDSVEELDWSTGEIFAALRRLGIDEHTLVIWTSDNGPVKRTPPQGSSAPYRGYGYDTSEGAMRMPCIMRWPGRIPAGHVSDQLCSTMDILPTVAKLAGTGATGNPIDGADISALILGEKGASSHWDEKGLAFYRMEQLQALRAGPWKLYLPLSNKYVTNARAKEHAPIALYNVRDDVHEDREVSGQHPDTVRRLLAMTKKIRAEIGDMDEPGFGQRPAGYVANPRPLRP